MLDPNFQTANQMLLYLTTIQPLWPGEANPNWAEWPPGEPKNGGGFNGEMQVPLPPVPKTEPFPRILQCRGTSLTRTPPSKGQQCYHSVTLAHPSLASSFVSVYVGPAVWSVPR